MRSRKNLPLGTLVVFAVFLLVMVATWVFFRPSPPPDDLEGVLRSRFTLLHPFELTDHRAASFSEKDLQGKWTFTFFGYTHCPDVCPTTLYELKSVLTLLERDNRSYLDDTQVLFVSVDPDRDTIDRLAQYVPYYGERMIGATSGRSAIEELARQFGAGYVIEPESSPGNYNVAHTSSIFLLDPFGRLVASFSQPHYAATIATQYQKIRSYFSGA